MITRDLGNLTIVSAFDSTAASGYRACTVSGTGTCTCAGVLSTDLGLFGFGGFMIDRFGLKDSYSGVAVAVDARAEVLTSAASSVELHYYAITAGLQHSSSTCSGGFTNLSTAQWLTDRPLVIQTTSTSTGSANAAYVNTDGKVVSDYSTVISSTAAGLSTSTGYARSVGEAATFALDAAKRYIRVVIAPNIMTTGCLTPAMKVNASLIFGDPGRGPFTIFNTCGTESTALGSRVRGRVQVTTGCST
jgi:archaellum component FlaG (FlaF/FlaG flagellin family)